MVAEVLVDQEVTELVEGMLQDILLVQMVEMEVMVVMEETEDMVEMEGMVVLYL